jgi:hypothetical protein
VQFSALIERLAHRETGSQVLAGPTPDGEQIRQCLTVSDEGF